MIHNPGQNGIHIHIVMPETLILIIDSHLFSQQISGGRNIEITAAELMNISVTIPIPDNQHIGMPMIYGNGRIQSSLCNLAPDIPPGSN